MKDFTRYAIYYAPRPGGFADRAASWLGWDAATGQAVPHPDLPGVDWPLADLTQAPRKYGFHGTIRAPFRLADGVTPEDLGAALQRLAGELPMVRMAGLALQRVQGFLALLPQGDETDLVWLGAEVVSRTEPLRAPLTATEIARRRPDRLTPRQRHLLEVWGYPHVMEEFQFHLTLTDRLTEAQGQTVIPALQSWLAPVLPSPFVIEDLCLFGEDATGQFHLLSRHQLAGA